MFRSPARPALLLPLPLLSLPILVLAACGQSRPHTPDGWLGKASDYYDNGGFGTRFQMEFHLVEDGQVIRIDHRGSLRGRDRQVFRLEAQTQMQIEDSGLPSVVIANTVCCDGLTLYAESLGEGQQQPEVFRQALDQNGGLSGAGGGQGSRLSPFDLDPLLLWRLAVATCTFEEQATGQAENVVLLGEVTDAFDEAAAQRSELFEPRQFRLTLDRASGAPVQLQLLSDARHGHLTTRFELWERADWDDALFRPPPAD